MLARAGSNGVGTAAGSLKARAKAEASKTEDSDYKWTDSSTIVKSGRRKHDHFFCRASALSKGTSSPSESPAFMANTRCFSKFTS